jgi:aspartate racemase
MSNEKLIGIMGGVGPYAGLDLVRKIFDQTKAITDQEHLPVALLSLPDQIPDRTAFLLGQTNTNPADAICDVLMKLEQLGATVAGIPCNTAHCAPIFEAVREQLEQAHCTIRLLHMIEEVALFIAQTYPSLNNFGVLSTTGTYRTRLYPSILGQHGYNVVEPNDATQLRTHATIYHPDYGIKAQSNPVSQIAQQELIEVVKELKKNGAEAIIAGCTEIALAIPSATIADLPVIDPTLVLARALIREFRPDKLRNHNPEQPSL